MTVNTKDIEKLLKIAAGKIAVQEKIIVELKKMASEKQKLEDAVKIAEIMWKKGMIEDNEIFQKIAEIKELPDKEFEQLKAKAEILSSSIFRTSSDESDFIIDEDEAILAQILE